MFRKYVIFSLAAMMVIGTSACTSQKASDDSADLEQNTGDESIESAEATENNDDLAPDKSGEAVAEANSVDDLAPDEKLPADGGNAVAGADNNQLAPNDLSETPPADAAVAQTDQAATPDAGAAASPTDTPPAETAQASPPPVEAPAAAPVPEPVAEAPKPVMSYQKVKSEPFRDHGILANAVYIARDGDTKESISQKVFGTNTRVKELCKVNKANCSRDAKVGDKFYYNSPQRPTDDTAMKTFYEDAGIAPTMYTAKSGDDIRKVGKTLLGNDRSWMELWATNSVESKHGLDEGTQLRYWPNTEAPAPTQTMAKNGPPGGEAAAAAGATGAPPPADTPPPQDMAANTPPPPPVPDQAQAAPPAPPAGAGDSLPPAPDQAQNQAAQGSVEPPPPPPPPPPTDAAQNRKEPAAVDASGATDPNQTVALGVGAVLLLAAAALFISIRKKRARRQIDFNTSTQTQIE